MKQVLSSTFLMFSLILTSNLSAQSYYFGILGGPSALFQKWNNINRDASFNFHGDVFIQSIAEDNVFYASVGLHKRGSSERLYLSLPNGNYLSNNRVNYTFNNASLGFGLKKNFELGDRPMYYIVGGRIEYTINNNLEEISNQYDRAYYGYFPLPDFINKFNYGATLGVGTTWKISKFVEIISELSLQPDISIQYHQFPIENVVSPINPSTRITLPEQKIRNISFELSVGFRFLREVIYR